MPDRVLQLRMLEDALDYNGNPGIVVLLTGDGAGYLEGAGFHSTLERMHKRGFGGWKFFPGRIPATSGCASGHEKTAYLSRWTTFMRPLRSWSRPDQGLSLHPHEIPRN